MIPLSRPWIPRRSHELVNEALGRGAIGYSRVYAPRVEDALCALLRRDYCVLTSSGTAALEAAFEAHAPEGDERRALVGATTFFATVEAARRQGYAVELAHGLDAWVTPSEAFENDADSLLAGIPTYGLVSRLGSEPLDLVDAAQAFGAPGLSSLTGDLVLSFFPSKTVTAGEGGAYLTDHPARFAAAASWINHGRAPNGSGYQHASWGTNARLSDLAAALLLGQIEELDEILAARRALALAWRAALEDVVPAEGVELWPGTERDVLWQYAFADADEARVERALIELREAGLDARRSFSPLGYAPPLVDERAPPRPPSVVLLPTWIGLPAEAYARARDALARAWRES